MAEFQKPKTNWIAADSFNIEDYNRIKNNLVYLKEISNPLFDNFLIQDMGLDLSYHDLPYASLLNKFENNLEMINNATMKLHIGDKKQFEPNGMFITYEELNRLETAIEKLYTFLYHSVIGIHRLGFKLGTKGAIKC